MYAEEDVPVAVCLGQVLRSFRSKLLQSRLQMVPAKLLQPSVEQQNMALSSSQAAQIHWTSDGVDLPAAALLVHDHHYVISEEHAIYNLLDLDRSLLVRALLDANECVCRLMNLRKHFRS